MANSLKAPSALAYGPPSAWPLLHAIVDADVSTRAGWTPTDFAAALLDGGATVLQVRAKQLSSNAFLQVCDTVVEQAQPYHATVLVNDRVDLAMLSGAAGAHVGQDDLSVGQARSLLGEDAVIGYSTHSLAQLTAGVRTSATYLAVGPVFGTRTKDTGYAAVGVDLVRLARRATERPLVAIGGITLENAGSVLDAGATVVAVISDLLVGNDPSARVRAYLALGAAR